MYNKEHGMPRIEDKETVKEELYAEFSGQQFMNKDFWDTLHERSPSLFQKVINIAKKIIDKIFEKLGKLITDENRFFRDIKQARDNLADVMKEYASKSQKVGFLCLQLPPPFSSSLFDGQRRGREKERLSRK